MLKKTERNAVYSEARDSMFEGRSITIWVSGI